MVDTFVRARVRACVRKGVQIHHAMGGGGGGATISNSQKKIDQNICSLKQANASNLDNICARDET